MTVVKCNIPNEIKSWIQYGTCFDEEKLFLMKAGSCVECITINSTPTCSSPIFCDTIITQVVPVIPTFDCQIIIEQI